VSQEENEQNEVDGMKKRADSTGKVMHNRLTPTVVIRVGLQL